MSYLSIIILAIALSIDACVVSFSYGLTYKGFSNALKLAGFTGGFQFLMPVIGYFLTGFVKSYIEPFADWVVFFIFTYLGIKFIIEAFEKRKAERLCIDIKCLFLTGIATSIDAFSAGITLSLYGYHILKPAVLIGIVTFVNSMAGFALGRRLKTFPSKWLEIFAGILLAALGIKAVIF